MKRIVFVLIAITLTMLTAKMLSSATVRYKLELNASINGEPVSGFVVNQVTYSGALAFLPNEAQFHVNVVGESAEVVLGNRGTLFALLRKGSDFHSAAEYIALKAFFPSDPGFPLPASKGLARVRALHGKVAIPLTTLPLLVRFRDERDPMTLEAVNPLNLAASFGDGVVLESATLEIVSDGYWPLSLLGLTGYPLTRKISQTLPWLPKLPGSGYLNGGVSSIGSPLGLQRYDFTRG